MSRPARIIIDLAALQHNFAQVLERVPASQIMAMVKSDAYGHGIERIAGALPMADAFGVACSAEGLALRETGITQPIVLMEGVFESHELLLAGQHHFSLVIHHMAQIDMLEKYPGRSAFSVWLKINTGMNRLGISVREVQGAWLRLMNCTNVRKPVGLMTHFAETTDRDSDVLKEQLRLFHAATAELPGPRSLAKSGIILGDPVMHGDWVRPGILLYGAAPWPDQTGESLGLRPVMTLASRLIAIQEVAKNQRVGYGGTWICPEDMRIGIVAAGYGDGYPQGACNGTPVLVGGKVCPLAGRVSMDMLAVDLRSRPEAAPGDLVTLWGKGLPVETVAEHVPGSSAWELLTRMTGRPRVVTIQPETVPAGGKEHAIF